MKCEHKWFVKKLVIPFSWADDSNDVYIFRCECSLCYEHDKLKFKNRVEAKNRLLGLENRPGKEVKKKSKYELMHE